MSLPQNLDDEEPIYQRTRTRMPLNHVTLDELDALLGKEDEGLFDEEGEQYRQFLRVSPSLTLRLTVRPCHAACACDNIACANLKRTQDASWQQIGQRPWSSQQVGRWTDGCSDRGTPDRKSEFKNTAC